MAFRFLVSAGLIVYTFGSLAQASLVQVTACSRKSGNCLISATGGGNLIVIGWPIGGLSGKAALSVTDNAGNVYKKAGEPVILPDRSTFDIWYAAGSLSGATSLVFTANSQVVKGNPVVWEFSGLDHPDQFQTGDWAHLINSAYSLAGKTVSLKTVASSIGPANGCDINRDGKVDVLDAQAAVNTTCIAVVCNGGLASQVINASMGSLCTHSVLLTWTASTAANIAGYNIYRGTEGAYTKINILLVGGTTYTDATVEPGQTYSYVATAVDASGAESGYSNSASALVPSP